MGSWSSHINYLLGDLSAAYQNAYDGRYWIDHAATYLPPNTLDLTNACMNLQAGGHFLATAVLQILSVNGVIGSGTSDLYYSIQHIPSYTLSLIPAMTYVDICNAWAKDSFRGRAETIAYIDRMRQLVWDEPFNVIWASRPEGG